LKSWEYIIQTKKEHIDFINKIVEAYEGAGNVRTLDNKNGLVKIPDQIFQTFVWLFQKHFPEKKIYFDFV